MRTKRDHKLQQHRELKREEINLSMFRMQRTQPNTEASTHGRELTPHPPSEMSTPGPPDDELPAQQRVCFNVLLLPLFCEPAVKRSQQQI